MYEKQLETIKDVGYGLSKNIKKTEDLEILEKLENANSYTEFRKILRIAIKKRIESGEKEPLFSFDDYVYFFFPESSLEWAEIQDLLLFRIYEVLNDWLAQLYSQKI